MRMRGSRGTKNQGGALSRAPARLYYIGRGAAECHAWALASTGLPLPAGLSPIGMAPRLQGLGSTWHPPATPAWAGPAARRAPRPTGPPFISPSTRRRRPARPVCTTSRTQHPGLTRQKMGRALRYLGVRGRPVRDPATLAPHPLARHPARVDEGLDLPRCARPHPGHRTRRARTQAVPLPPALARRPRRGEVRTHARLRPGPADHPRARRGRPRPPGPARAARCWRR